MITKEEAQERIKRWRGDYQNELFTRPDGFKFMRTRLFYFDPYATRGEIVPGSSGLVDPIYNIVNGKNIIVDEFVYPIE